MGNCCKQQKNQIQQSEQKLSTFQKDKILKKCSYCITLVTSKSAPPTQKHHHHLLSQIRWLSSHHSRLDSLIESSMFESKVNELRTRSYDLIALRTDCEYLIDKDIRDQLIEAVKPLQNNLHNYRNAELVTTLSKYDGKEKPKCQELIHQFAFYKQYKQLRTLMKYHLDGKVEFESYPNMHRYYEFKPDADGLDDMYGIEDHLLPVSLTPAIFSMRKQKFITEINGLLYRENVELYALIEKIFIKLIPMFECVMDKKLLYNIDIEQLEVIIKIQDWQFTNGNAVKSRWHQAGSDDDHIECIGLYYFDMTEQENSLKFSTNSIQIRIDERSSEPISIHNNDCVVFRNKCGNVRIEHRAFISSKELSDYNAETLEQPISRKMLGFFVLKPRDSSIINKGMEFKAEDYKWINFPMKVDTLVNYMVNYEIDIVDDVILLIQYFAFGDEKYQRQQLTQFSMNRQQNRKESWSVSRTETEEC